MLEKVDLSLTISKDKYNEILPDKQYKLVKLQQEIRKNNIPVIIMYEGVDAGGKGGSILRITEKIDPRGFRVYPIGVPTDVEKSNVYLWRFWTKIPPAGEIAIFDRSWYGRVLVERVEKFAKQSEWKRAYNEINDFEKYLVDNGVVLIKFWMNISKDEQLKRFKDREANPIKQWKITPDDWRNREKWDLYIEAAEDMFKKTDTDYAPWTIVPGECKRYGRIFTIDTVIDRIKSRIDKL